MLLSELLERQKESEKVAIKYGENMVTYKEWYNNSLQLSNVLHDNTTENSLNIAIFLPNSIHYAVAYFSILFSNKIIVPIATQSKGKEITSTLEYCEIDVIITSLQYRDFLKDCLSTYNYQTMLLFVDDQSIEKINCGEYFIVKSDAIKDVKSEDDVAIMLHTSGTTSNPKRVMLTHSNLINNVQSNVKSLKLTVNDKALIAMPMFFGYCNTAQFLTHLYIGASIVILDTMFLPKQFFQAVENEHITNFTGVPSMLLMLLEYQYAYKHEYASLRYICFGGGKMPVSKLRTLIEKYPSIGFVQTYGQTECSPRVTALLPRYALSKLGSVGSAIPNVKIKIVDEAGHNLPRGKTGEIIVNGKNIMKGYYKQPQITQKTVQNGWVHTGDLGYVDSDGFLYLNGRIKNMIISGGINIYPEEIEQLLLQHECVSETCVVGEKHEMLGEIPIAKIVLKSDISSGELRKYCNEYITSYKIPARFDFVNCLSKTYNGKVKRFEESQK